MPQALGYAAMSAGKPLEPYRFARREMRPNDVAIEILYCGVCHSDMHTARNDWGRTKFPIVPGHEIIGRVTATGADVSAHKAGDIVGVGCMVDSCMTCRPCDEDMEQYCEVGMVGTYSGVDYHDGSPTLGGYSDSIVVRDHFVVKIPGNMALDAAAPLLCAGITCWSPLRDFKIGSGHKVAVAGMGGLGHMGIKLAKALGAEVTLFTRSADKASEARQQGADHVIISSDPAQMAAASCQFDMILDTIPAPHDFTPYLDTLAISGALVILGLIDFVKPPVHTMSLIHKRRILTASKIGGMAETQEMLDFCAEKGITCDIEMIDIQDIGTAYERMDRSDVKYRFVIDMASLKAEGAAA